MHNNSYFAASFLQQSRCFYRFTVLLFSRKLHKNPFPLQKTHIQLKFWLLFSFLPILIVYFGSFCF
ncbi:hypothetical protein CLOM621_05242 [Clostridium sp. M62/1]|nr:hypothetical protein CLOM621_05242 [Clostridium sp. M62/1]